MFCNSINLGIQNFERERQKDESINIFKRPIWPMRQTYKMGQAFDNNKHNNNTLALKVIKMEKRRQYER